MAAIALRNVRKQYPAGHVAARDLTLDIDDGELLVLVGPSGSGKSTVLRLIAGLEPVTAGRILIDGADVTTLPPQRRDVAMVFQSYALYPHKTVRQNLAFGLQVRRVEGSTIERRVRMTAEALGIAPLLDRKPAQLSGGQRQRVALGRAMVREPKAFLLDEPLSNLDPTLRVATRAELAMLHRRLAATMVYVTHDQEEAMTLGSRIGVMREGTLEQVGPAMDVFRRPANVFVATFIGSPSMNLWRGRIHRTNRGSAFVTTAGSITLEHVDASIAGDPDVLLGVRPHDIDFVERERSDATGRVEIVEPLGPVTLAHVRPERADELVRIVTSGDTTLAADDTVSFRVRRDRLHVFDAGSGRRLSRVSTRESLGEVD